eukprot:TRINITY_DN5622_c0_g1_i7.p1 TRINITY_DN5622_c0_g1~~TRINITY_DN5622_c0_g1_i7.p1  ORF type:complete len:284 (-),score=50.57 TRINITY_DN5622_c0_g1_i7:910-1761(-)
MGIDDITTKIMATKEQPDALTTLQKQMEDMTEKYRKLKEKMTELFGWNKKIVDRLTENFGQMESRVEQIEAEIYRRPNGDYSGIDRFGDERKVMRMVEDIIERRISANEDKFWSMLTSLKSRVAILEDTHFSDNHSSRNQSLASLKEDIRKDIRNEISQSLLQHKPVVAVESPTEQTSKLRPEFMNSLPSRPGTAAAESFEGSRPSTRQRNTLSLSLVGSLLADLRPQDDSRSRPIKEVSTKQLVYQTSQPDIPVFTKSLTPFTLILNEMNQQKEEESRVLFP